MPADAGTGGSAKKKGAPRRARLFSRLPRQMTNTQLAISITTTPAISVR